MKRKATIIFSLILTALIVPLASADFHPGQVNLYVWVDKQQYKAGEAVTVYFTIFNDKSTEIAVKGANVTTPWFMYAGSQWEGNQTIKMKDTILLTGESYRNYTTLTIPNDGRAFFVTSYAPITVNVQIDNALESRTINIYIADPLQSSIRQIDTIVLLMAVLIIIIVTCTALIAAAIFLSARKPRETC